MKLLGIIITAGFLFIWWMLPNEGELRRAQIQRNMDAPSLSAEEIDSRHAIRTAVRYRKEEVAEQVRKDIITDRARERRAREYAKEYSRQRAEGR